MLHSGHGLFFSSNKCENEASRLRFASWRGGSGLKQGLEVSGWCVFARWCIHFERGVRGGDGLVLQTAINSSCEGEWVAEIAPTRMGAGDRMRAIPIDHIEW